VCNKEGAKDEDEEAGDMVSAIPMLPDDDTDAAPRMRLLQGTETE
jgi:hypothetical protein